MVFSSVIFIFIFLPVVFLIYTASKSLKLKNLMLALASIVFYAIGEPTAVILMLLSVLLNYCFALLISREKYKKAFLFFSIIFNIGIIFVFKYLNYVTHLSGVIFNTKFETHILLPVGISFFTFQIMSYVIDVYRGDTKPQKNFLNVLLYISFFPQLIAGPIVKYHDIEKQLVSRAQTADGVFLGIKRFCVGLAKKVLIADIIAVYVDYVFALSNENIKTLSAPVIILTAIGYSLQIYFDFSGYSDMAIGMAGMFGFKIKENFNYPYVSSSIKEFWRRWHISLSTWFKEYVYIPLGGNRKGKARTYVNKFTVFLLTGIWHGANVTFLLWGIIHGFFITAEDFIKLPKGRKTKWISHLYTMTVVVLAFVVFRAENITQAGTVLSRLIKGWSSFKGEYDMLFWSYFSPVTLIVLIAGLILSAPVIPHLKEKLKLRGELFEIIEGVICLVLFVLSVIALVSNGYSPNIYNQF